MKLLQWSILEPAGPSNLAAIRFSSPSRVQSIRIFPTGTRPFAQNEGIVARTEPGAFFLDVYFNAHSTPSTTQPTQSDAKQKQKAPNALVPTIIAYSGGEVDFTVNMGDDFSTRLMIVSGNFECVSMAVYGEVAAERNPSPALYQPLSLPAVDPLPVTNILDPHSSQDPTLLAKRLLELIPGAPNLSLVIRLMFCLKPSNDDWEHPEFPHLYSDLDEEELDTDLESAFRCMSRPVSDDTKPEFLQRFAEKVSDALGPKDDSQSYLIAGILYRAASQHPYLAQTLMDHLDFEQIFDISNMDEVTILRLWDASANPDIARSLNSEWFMNLADSIQSSPISDHKAKEAARKLVDRIQRWQIFEDALSNTQAHFSDAASLMTEVGIDEQSFGIWLESMISHEGLVVKLQENPIFQVKNQSHPSPLLHSYTSAVSHHDFISFVRTYIGVACVLAVYAWSDSLPNDQCRERALGILRLWQEIDGYREIVNHLLLLRQMTFRIECMTADNDPPTRSGIHAEQILLDLARHPRSFLREDFVKCVLSLRQPLSYINEDQRLSIRRAALVADDGLPAAIDTLTRTFINSWDIDQIRVLRVALSVIGHHLQKEETGDWAVLEAVWREGTHCLASYLVDILVNVSRELTKHFGLTPTHGATQEIIHQLFSLSNDLFVLITHIGPASMITSRPIKYLTVAVSDIFVCTNFADMSFSQTSPACRAAQSARQACIDLMRTFTEPTLPGEPTNKNSPLILRTLFEEGLRLDDRDPAHHLLQVFYLVDHIIPLSPAETSDGTFTSWLLANIPNVLNELGAFFRALDVENKAHMIKRLLILDQNVIGIGEWLLQEELKYLTSSTQSLDKTLGEENFLVAQHQVFLALHLVSDLVVPSSQASPWATTALVTNPEMSRLLVECMYLSLKSHLYSNPQARIAQHLSSHLMSADSGLKTAVILTRLRGIQFEDLSSPLGDTLEFVLTILRSMDDDEIYIEELQKEVGCAMLAVASSIRGLSSLDTKSADALVLTVSWLMEKAGADTFQLPGISDDVWEKLYGAIEGKMSIENRAPLNTIREKLHIHPHDIISTTLIPENLELSLQTIARLLEPPIVAPSTPRRKSKSPGQDVLGLVALSPPTAILRSPAVTGLTKTYLNNDFRQLRQLPSARQNTSRLPSMHVDEFELTTSPPTLLPNTESFSLAPPFNITQ